LILLTFYVVKAKYGSDYDPNSSDSGLSTDSESAESEDEDGEELTPTVDVAILRTLARIKERDPAIYDSSKNIFGGTFSCPMSASAS
jgi:protein KRI1